MNLLFVGFTILLWLLVLGCVVGCQRLQIRGKTR